MIDFKGLQIIAYQFFNKQGVMFKHYPGKRERIELYLPGHFFTEILAREVESLRRRPNDMAES